jgi:hypothetical protein
LSTRRLSFISLNKFLFHYRGVAAARSPGPGYLATFRYSGRTNRQKINPPFPPWQGTGKALRIPDEKGGKLVSLDVNGNFNRTYGFVYGVSYIVIKDLFPFREEFIY